MIAIDTNVVIRYLTRDDKTQAARARALLDTRDVFVCTTVLLETEWVLRAVYGFAPDRIANAIRAFAGLPRVVVDDRETLVQALTWMDSGLDFADALHLAKGRGCEAFATFDRAFIKAAKRADAGTTRLP